jgi:hypothetical protein
MRTSSMSFYTTASSWRLLKKTGTGVFFISNFFEKQELEVIFKIRELPTL